MAGSLHLDVVVDAPRLPALDETLMGSRVAYRFGGKGGNQALAAARMGAEVSMAGRVGNDSFAEPVLTSLAAAGVDAAQVRQVDGATGTSVAIVNGAGEYGAVVVSGVNLTIAPDEVDPRGADVILLQNEISEAVNLSVARRAGDATVVLNAAPARAVSPELLSLVDVLVVNRIEAAQIEGRDGQTFDPESAAEVLSALGPRTVIVTLGEKGGVICESGGTFRYSPPLRASGSTHGAGDSFVGALAAELARGEPIAEAVAFSARAAAHFVATAPEAREGIRRSDVETWTPDI